jgi:hypothetical protein
LHRNISLTYKLYAMQKIFLPNQGLLLILFLFATSYFFKLTSQTTLTLDQLVTIYPGTPEDYVIPPMAGDLVVKLRGGDGGGIRFSGLICETTVEGGSGATIDATFEVGFAAGQLQPGGTIRVMVGEKGESDSKACGSGAASYAAGGGSSAILYLPPNADASGMNWQLLAVAGAGGGAARPSSGIDRTGQGANASDPSDGVNGIGGATNGNVGDYGTGNSFLVEGAPGAGYNGENGTLSFCSNTPLSSCRWSGKNMVETAQTTGNLITVKLLGNNHYNFTGSTGSSILGKVMDGGKGFTGGGLGSTNAIDGATAGGGGGGFSGGSVNYYFGGGGGSSYLTSGVNTTSSNISPGSNGASGHFNGYVQLTANAAPIITQASCQNQTVQLDANGQASLNASQLNNGSTGFAPLTYTVNGNGILNFTCADVGTIGVTLTLTDVYQTTSTCSATITIQDNVGPTATCQDVTVQLNASGNAFINTCSIDAGSNDACSGFVGITLNQTTFNCSNIGSNTVTMTVTDVNGNTSTCTSNVTVQDQVNPMASCKNVIVQLDGSGNGSLTAAMVDNGSSDVCGIATYALDQYTFDCTHLGPNIVTLSVTDQSGNTGSCMATVTVEDNIPLVAACQDVVVQLDASGSGSLTTQEVDSGSSDNCGITNRSLSQVSFSCEDIGSTTVSLTVTSGSGQSSSCTALVSIIDEIVPTAACQGRIVQLDESGQVTVDANSFDNGSMDNCSLNRLYFPDLSTVKTFGCSDVGTLTYTNVIVEDNAGNMSYCNVSLTIEDNIAPNAMCKDATIVLDAGGIAAFTPQMIDNGSNDACGIASMSVDVTSFDCSDEGSNYMLALQIMDNHGNFNSCMANVNIIAGTSLPDNWSEHDLGIVTIGNEYAYSPCEGNGQFHITGSGNNGVGFNTDHVAFASTSLCGDGSITAKIESVDPNGWGGLMIRETADDGAKQVSIFTNLSNLLRHEVRYNTNGTKAVNSFYKPSPYWLKLERQGDWFFAYYSATGLPGSFQYVHGVFLPMQNCLEYGLASFTNEVNQQTTTVFSNVSLAGGITPTAVTPPDMETEEATVRQVPGLYPNPGSDVVNLIFGEGLDEEATVILRNQAGQVIEQRTLRTGDLRTEWAVSTLAEGLYTFEIHREGEAVQVLKFVKAN